MSLDPSLEEQELLADTLARERSRMTARERLAGALTGVPVLAAVAVLWVAQPPGAFDLGPAALCLVVFVAASLVSFDTPFGFTVLTQLAFVPLLFAMPACAVPLAAALGLAIARVPDVVRGELPAVRLLQAFGNSWFAVGPAVVFALAGVQARDAGALLLAAALAAEFAADFAASTLRYRISREASLAMQLRETWVYAIDAALSGVALVIAKRVPSEPAVVLALVPLLGLFAVLARERRERLQSLLELNNAYRGTALVLGDVVAADDGYTGEHCKDVVALTLSVAERLGLSSPQRRDLEFAALLHDVGKITVPNAIVNKPGALDEDEWAIIRGHTIEGQRMLDRVGGFMREVGVIVRAHHERWDGNGYPDGLAGEDIPLQARIISCCDTWNAMRTDRSYRRALSYEVAMAELLASAGTQLDPAVIDALVAVLGAGAQLQPARTPVADERPELLAGAPGRAC